MCRTVHLFAGVCLMAMIVGCTKPAAEKTTSENEAEKVSANAEIPEGIAELSPEDQKLALAQKICPVSGEPLGSMGKPPKITLEGTEIFLCCKGCEGDAMADPKGTLAKLKK
jgi:hypothetical protein